MTKINAAQIVAKVRELAEAEPTFIYRRPVRTGAGCSYVTGADGRGCIVGQALEALGSPVEGDPVAPVDELLGELSIPGTIAEVNWLYEVQAEQDAGEQWSAATATADARVSLR